MFCFQCEQTSKGTGCNEFAVCGKDEETARLQDLLLHATKAVAQYAHRARAFGATDPVVDRFILRGLFLTVTNVNFDPQAIEQAIRLGLPRVEAGAQGQHKIARGYLPSPVYSTHYIADPALRGPVERFVMQERQGVEQEMEWLTEEFSPFKAES